MSWTLIGNAAFYFATASTILFTVLYAFLAPWWTTNTGRNIISVMGTMALAFSYFSWAIAIGGIPPGFDVMRALLFICIAASVTWRTGIFLRRHVLQSLRTNEREEKHELEDAR